ncbi:hypothetical protein CYMTET_13178 [Cymbomonas tetramitiformis]|uniref:Uncharacterized protein n=1 Tax=Cymbomonas tetramitiformis TaxID=36881 RepID=A0AAE0GJ81_9CHLO|nr:hypothetical protein CYMTET_13178 [Cymbomonas tetramitiformis]
MIKQSNGFHQTLAQSNLRAARYIRARKTKRIKLVKEAVALQQSAAGHPMQIPFDLDDPVLALSVKGRLTEGWVTVFECSAGRAMRATPTTVHMNFSELLHDSGVHCTHLCIANHADRAITITLRPEGTLTDAMYVDPSSAHVAAKATARIKCAVDSCATHGLLQQVLHMELDTDGSSGTSALKLADVVLKASVQPLHVEFSPSTLDFGVVCTSFCPIQRISDIKIPLRLQNRTDTPILVKAQLGKFASQWTSAVGIAPQQLVLPACSMGGEGIFEVCLTPGEVEGDLVGALWLAMGSASHLQRFEVRAALRRPHFQILDEDGRNVATNGCAVASLPPLPSVQPGQQVSTTFHLCSQAEAPFHFKFKGTCLLGVSPARGTLDPGGHAAITCTYAHVCSELPAIGSQRFTLPLKINQDVVLNLHMSVRTGLPQVQCQQQTLKFQLKHDALANHLERIPSIDAKFDIKNTGTLPLKFRPASSHVVLFQKHDIMPEGGVTVDPDKSTQLRVQLQLAHLNACHGHLDFATNSVSHPTCRIKYEVVQEARSRPMQFTPVGSVHLGRRCVGAIVQHTLCVHNPSQRNIKVKILTTKKHGLKEVVFLREDAGMTGAQEICNNLIKISPTSEVPVLVMVTVGDDTSARQWAEIEVQVVERKEYTMGPDGLLMETPPHCLHLTLECCCEAADEVTPDEDSNVRELQETPTLLQRSGMFSAADALFAMCQIEKSDNIWVKALVPVVMAIDAVLGDRCGDMHRQLVDCFQQNADGGTHPDQGTQQAERLLRYTLTLASGCTQLSEPLFAVLLSPICDLVPGCLDTAIQRASAQVLYLLAYDHAYAIRPPMRHQFMLLEAVWRGEPGAVEGTDDDTSPDWRVMKEACGVLQARLSSGGQAKLFDSAMLLEKRAQAMLGNKLDDPTWCAPAHQPIEALYEALGMVFKAMGHSALVHQNQSLLQLLDLVVNTARPSLHRAVLAFEMLSTPPGCLLPEPEKWEDLVPLLRVMALDDPSRLDSAWAEAILDDRKLSKVGQQLGCSDHVETGIHAAMTILRAQCGMTETTRRIMCAAKYLLQHQKYLPYSPREALEFVGLLMRASGMSTLFDAIATWTTHLGAATMETSVVLGPLKHLSEFLSDGLDLSPLETILAGPADESTRLVDTIPMLVEQQRTRLLEATKGYFCEGETLASRVLNADQVFSNLPSTTQEQATLCKDLCALLIPVAEALDTSPHDPVSLLHSSTRLMRVLA